MNKRSKIYILLTLFVILAINITTASAKENHSKVRYGIEKVNGLDIFYREAGDPSKQAVVLLHGFPHSSHQYRQLLAELGDEFYLIAPDYPGFGDSSFPSPIEFDYTFDNFANIIDAFLVQRKINNYVLMIQDYGAPVGLRIATKHPEKVAGFVVMNGNIYEEGVNHESFKPIISYWKNKNDLELEKTITQHIFSPAGLQWQYTHGTRNPESINPDNWNLDILKFSREGQYRMQLDLFFDYQNNLPLYPVWQQYMRDNQPPMLIVWGKNDAFFTEAGAAAFKRDVKDIDYHILNTGHFPLEEDAPFIIDKMRLFLAEKIK